MPTEDISRTSQNTVCVIFYFTNVLFVLEPDDTAILVSLRDKTNLLRNIQWFKLLALWHYCPNLAVSLVKWLATLTTQSNGPGSDSLRGQQGGMFILKCERRLLNVHSRLHRSTDFREI